MKNTVNTRVKLLRTSLRLTQNEFASELGISSSLVSKLEAGEKPSAGTLDTIIQKYQVPESWILEGKGEMKYTKPTKETLTDPWRDVALKEVANERDNLRKEVQNLWGMIDDFRNGRLSFLTSVKEVA